MSNCTNCGIELNEENCYRKSNGYFRVYCKKCHNQRSNEANKISSKQPHRKAKSNLKRRLDRKDPTKIASVILKDSKNSDKKHNRENDLTKDFVQSKIDLGCHYCRENSLRMTLDRIDNTLGHIQNNVVPACIRCNYARGDMPYEAWLCLCDGLKEAKEKGLFGNWTGRCR